MPQVVIQGHRIDYREAGEGRAVLLLHGLAGSSRFWEDTLKALPEGFRGIAPDLLGFGDSEKPKEEVGISRHVAMLEMLAQSLGLTRWDLVGHSMGGMVALAWALKAPKTVRKMILVNTPISGGRALHGRGWIGATLPGLIAVKFGLQLPPVLWILRRLLRYYYVLDPRFTKDAKKAPLYSLRESARALRECDFSARLSEIKIPTLVIGTREDGIVRPSEFERAAREIPGAEAVWIEGAGHCPTLERPEKTHGAMMDFLQS